MPVLLLVRHGQASFGADDYDVLSEAGQEQAVLAGAELRRRGLTDPLLVTGTLRRQRDTASLLDLTAEPTVDPRWDEYDHLGLVSRYHADAQLDGTSRGLQDALDVALTGWTQDADGTWPAFRAGAVDALAEVAASCRASGRDAVVVTSGGILATVTAHLLGVPDAAVVPLNRVCVNTALTKVVIGRLGLTLLTFNEHPHLEAVDRRLLTYR